MAREERGSKSGGARPPCDREITIVAFRERVGDDALTPIVRRGRGSTQASRRRTLTLLLSRKAGGPAVERCGWTGFNLRERLQLRILIDDYFLAKFSNVLAVEISSTKYQHGSITI
jgi:hypothetical protein